MKITAQIKLKPSEEQRKLLLQTLKRANEACNWISEWTYENEKHAKYKIQEQIYHDVRERFDLSARMTVRAIGKVADAYSTNSDTQNDSGRAAGFRMTRVS